MKKLTCLLLISALCTFIFAQDDEFKTIFNRDQTKPLKISGFGGPMMSFGTINGNFAHMMGGGGGVIINNLFVGGYGMGLTTQNYYINQSSYQHDSTYLGYGHGGFWIGYIILPKKAMHLSVSSLLGWGNISEQIQPDMESIHNYPVFVITPFAELELNFSKFLKVGLGSSFSLVRELKYDSGYSSRDFMSPTFFLSFKFGWFE